MQITLISPYHGGSHQAWAEGYRRYSKHDLELLTLPARFWKWRMHGAAVTLARRFLQQPVTADLLLVTDMLDLTTFLALTRRRTANTPVALYMHENQLTYPLPADPTKGPMRRQLGERDRHYAFINYASMLAADRVLFNSRYHRRSFLEALPKFLRHFPEYKELGSVRPIERRSAVLPVGIDLQRLDPRRAFQRSEEPPLILWNQRWEYDKNPEAFFAALHELAGAGVAFRLALCGQQYGKRPAVFDEALERLGSRVIHAGHARLPRYRELLWEATVTVSTAHHEFFGIAILEAIYAHTFPILPRRLSYPEIIPAAFHEQCLYQGTEELLSRLRWALQFPQQARREAAQLAATVVRYDWQSLASSYDELLEGLVEN